MAITTKTDIQRNEIDEIKHNLNDLRVFLAYIEELCSFKQISVYRCLKNANMQVRYVAQIKQYMKNPTKFRKRISLALLIHISVSNNFPFDLSRYIHLIEDNTATQEQEPGE